MNAREQEYSLKLFMLRELSKASRELNKRLPGRTY